MIDVPLEFFETHEIRQLQNKCAIRVSLFNRAESQALYQLFLAEPSKYDDWCDGH